MEIRNVRSYPLALDGIVCQPGDTITVPDDLGRAACEQPGNWRPVKRKTPPELDAAPVEPDPETIIEKES
jgi:hypothetical protein